MVPTGAARPSCVTSRTTRPAASWRRMRRTRPRPRGVAPASVGGAFRRKRHARQYTARPSFRVRSAPKASSGFESAQTGQRFTAQRPREKRIRRCERDRPRPVRKRGRLAPVPRPSRSEIRYPGTPYALVGPRRRGYGERGAPAPAGGPDSWPSGLWGARSASLRRRANRLFAEAVGPGTPVPAHGTGAWAATPREPAPLLCWTPLAAVVLDRRAAAHASTHRSAR